MPSKEDKKAYDAAYYQANKERILKRNSEWEKKGLRVRPETHKEYERERWRNIDPATVRKYNLRRYSITVEGYEQMLADQGGVCAICGLTCTRHPHLSVDHCHETKVVRGLLCWSCNILLGFAHDSSDLLEEAAAYLRQGRE